VSGLSEAFWKQISATKILFQTSQQDQSMTLRVTSKRGVIYTYSLTLETKPATIAIRQVDAQKNLSGTISTHTTLPLTIQSFIDGKSWPISTPFIAKEQSFTTSFSGIVPEWSVSYSDQKVFSVKRETGVIVAESGITFVPVVQN